MAKTKAVADFIYTNYLKFPSGIYIKYNYKVCLSYI